MKKKLIIQLTTTYLQFADAVSMPFDQFDFCLIVDKLEQHYLDIIHPLLKQDLHIITDGEKNDLTVLLNYEQVKNKVIEIIKERHHHYRKIYLVTTNEINIINTAKIAKELNLESRAPEFLERYRDKALMKKMLQQHHIRVPRFLIIDKTKLNDLTSYYEELCNTVGKIFIIKPTDMAGSLDVCKISNKIDFNNWYETIAPHPFTFEAEEFIEGKLYHCDNVMNHHNDIIFTACDEYTFPVAEAFERKTPLGSYALAENDPVFKQLNEFSHKVLRALGGCIGVSHMEIFITQEDELVFLEVAARPPGAVSMLMYKEIYGISLVNWHFYTLANIHFNTHYHRQTNGFWAIIPPIKGKIAAIHSFSDFKGNILLDLNVKVGDTLHGMSHSAVDSVGYLQNYHDNMTIIQEDFQRLKECEVLKAEKE